MQVQQSPLVAPLGSTVDHKFPRTLVVPLRITAPTALLHLQLVDKGTIAQMTGSGTGSSCVQQVTMIHTPQAEVLPRRRLTTPHALPALQGLTLMVFLQHFHAPSAQQGETSRWYSVVPHSFFRYLCYGGATTSTPTNVTTENGQICPQVCNYRSSKFEVLTVTTGFLL